MGCQLREPDAQRSRLGTTADVTRIKFKNEVQISIDVQATL